MHASLLNKTLPKHHLDDNYRNFVLTAVIRFFSEGLFVCLLYYDAVAWAVYGNDTRLKLSSHRRRDETV